MPISYLQGDATAPQAAGVKLIAHVCNDRGGWGRGFVLALSRRWPEPEQAFRAWFRDRAENDFALGVVQFVQVEPDIWVANLVGQHGTNPKAKVPPVRYEAIDQGLSRVAERAQTLKASVHMPRIGCGLAGGSWDRVEPMIESRLVHQGIEVFVYDYAS